MGLFVVPSARRGSRRADFWIKRVYRFSGGAKRRPLGKKIFPKSVDKPGLSGVILNHQRAKARFSPMTKSIFSILLGYGFQSRNDGSIHWGCGTLVSGYYAIVRHIGKDLYEVTYREWFYDPDMEPLKDINTVSVLHGALLLQYLFERLPIFRYWR